MENETFRVTLVGIVYNKKLKKMLIGRRESDPLVPELSWSFPGGGLTSSKDLKEFLEDEIKNKTSIDIRVKKLVLARITPEIERKQVILYYYCETNEENAVAGEKFVEVKWISPEEWKDYFKTSVHPDIIKFLEKLK